MRTFRLSALVTIAALAGSVVVRGRQTPSVSLQREFLETLAVLSRALLDTQITDASSPDHGALVCPETKDLHTRAGEAVYPFAIMFKRTNDERQLRAAVALGNWLIRQQAKDGEWAETPWTWTGTTTDQLLMMSLAYPILEPHLTAAERLAWRTSIERAAAYLVERMSPDFATINYCATTPATLAVTDRLFPNPAYLPKARQLARQVLARMNADGFIEGEAARVGAVKYGVDPGYEMDMSFWGLALYAKLTGDSLVDSYVRRAARSHLSLVYPDGMIDGSWGTRSYKWTTYGTKTGDGSQVLFSLLAPEDARYRTAAIRNLELLRSMIKNGLVGSGPHFFELTHTPPCIYSTFARAKNLALAAELADPSEGDTPPLPSDKPGMLTVYPTVNVALARTQHFMVTVSAYQYVDQQNWGEGRYSQFPGGGSAANVWVRGLGLLQTSSPTRYVRGEVIHMPEIKEGIRPLTPRIEFADAADLFTNLYERTGQMSVTKHSDAHVEISVSGELKNERLLPGGVAYRLSHEVRDTTLTKRVALRYHSRSPSIDIVEPVLAPSGTTVARQGARAVSVRSGAREVRLELVEGDAEFVLGEGKELFWHPFPAVRCYPIVLRLQAPTRPFEAEQFLKTVSYRFSVR